MSWLVKNFRIICFSLWKISSSSAEQKCFQKFSRLYLIKVTGYDYWKWPSHLTILRDEKASVSSLSQTLPGSVPVFPPASSHWIVWDNSFPLQLQGYFPLFAGATPSQAWASQLFKKGDCEDLNGRTLLAATCTLREKATSTFEKPFLILKLQSTPQLLLRAFSDCLQYTCPVLLGSLRSPEASLRAQD